MSPSTIGAIGVLALFTLLLLRVPVWIALTLVGFCGNAIMSGVQPSGQGSPRPLCILMLLPVARCQRSRAMRPSVRAASPSTMAIKS